MIPLETITNESGSIRITLDRNVYTARELRAAMGLKAKAAKPEHNDGLNRHERRKAKALRRF